MDIKEAGSYSPAKLPSLNREQVIQNKEISDAIKHINNQIRILNDKINELESAEGETFKYIKGGLSKDRTKPNVNKEIEFRSKNNTINFAINDNVVDMRVKDVVEFSEYTIPGGIAGFYKRKIENHGEYWIPLYTSISP